jgi:hypothetical protein
MAPPLAIALPDLAESLLTAMIQQTRYDTRDLLLAGYPDVFSRFMVTALRQGSVGDLALASAGMGAFIGFACEAFRRHDYLLGRKNCQDFLRSQFVLPQASPVFANCLHGVPLGDYLVRDQTGCYLPIIPLVSDARVPEATDAWPVGALDPARYRPGIDSRFTRLMAQEFGGGPLSSVLVWLAARVGEGKVADFVVAAMRDALKQWKLG